MPCSGSSPPIKSILKDGNRRIVVLESGTRIPVDKGLLSQKFHAVLRQDQFNYAKRSLRTDANGGVNVTVGGKKLGDRKHYASKQRALAALKKRYSQ